MEDLILKQGDTTALSHIASLYPGHKQQYLRNQLGLFGIRGSTASQPMNTLSGDPQFPPPPSPSTFSLFRPPLYHVWLELIIQI